MSEKSHVAIDCCFICSKETGLVLDTRLRQTLPRHVSSGGLCDECESRRKTHVALIQVADGPKSQEPNRTGLTVWLPHEAVRRNMIDKRLAESIIRKGLCYITASDWERMGLPAAPPLDAEPASEKIPQ